MTESDQTTCLDPYLAPFEQIFVARNYKPATLENYRYHLRRFGKLMEVEGITPSALTAEIAVALGRKVPTSPKAQIKVPNLARLFVEHLIEIGVARQHIGRGERPEEGARDAVQKEHRYEHHDDDEAREHHRRAHFEAGVEHHPERRFGACPCA